MEIRTFRAASLQEALLMVREQLGTAASVLHMREVSDSARGGKSTKPLVEVDASLDLHVASRFTTSEVNKSAPTSAVRAFETAVTHSANTPAAPTTLPRIAPGTSVPEWKHQESFASVAPDGLPNRPNLASASEAALELGARLVDRGFTSLEARELISQAIALCTEEQTQDTQMLQVSLLQLLAKQIRIGGAIELDENEPTVVAFVGPAGSGKTTTLAKLAANFRLDVGCRIGMVTIDTVRLGAVDQLLHYADHFAAQLEVISTPDQVEPALVRLRECDLVLLDTAGVSSGDDNQLKTLQRLLKIAQPDSVQLVINADRSFRSAKDTVERFKPISATHLLLSKVDESAELASWLPLLTNEELPVSYIANGQRVPNDLVLANQRQIASLLLQAS